LTIAQRGKSYRSSAKLLDIYDLEPENFGVEV
jgi:hypothetical protein